MRRPQLESFSMFNDCGIKVLPCVNENGDNNNDMLHNKMLIQISMKFLIIKLFNSFHLIILISLIKIFVFVSKSNTFISLY